MLLCNIVNTSAAQEVTASDKLTKLAYMDASCCKVPHELGRKPVNWLLDKSSSVKLLMFATICEGSGPDSLQSKLW